MSEVKETGNDGIVQLVCFRVDEEEYGINIMEVQEIIRVSNIKTVPKSPGFVLGIVTLREKCLAVVDLRKRFGLDNFEHTNQSRIIVVEISGNINGFLVDSITEVLRILKSQTEIPPHVVSNGKNENQFIEGIGKLNDGKRIITILKPDFLLSSKDKIDIKKIEKETLDHEKKSEKNEEAVKKAA